MGSFDDQINLTDPVLYLGINNISVQIVVQWFC